MKKPKRIYKAIIRDVGKKWRIIIYRDGDVFDIDYLVDVIELERRDT